MQEGAFTRVVEEAIKDRLRRQHRAQRQEAAGEAFRQAQQIRLDACLLAGEQRAGAAEAHRDFIGDQEHAVQIAQFAHAAQVSRMMHAHAAGALHQRLDDHRADFAGMRVQQGLQRIGGTLRTGDGRGLVAAAECIGRGGEQHVQQQRGVHPAVQRDVAHRQCPQRFTVVAVGQRDEARAPGVATVVEPVERHLQCDFHTGRTVVGIEHLGQRLPPGLLRGASQQAFGQFHRRCVREPGQDDLLQRARLPADGLGDARFGMAMQVGPPTADPVQHAAAVEPHQPRTFAMRDGEQRQGIGVFAHLRAWVPQHGQIACAPVAGGGYHGGIVKSFHPPIIAGAGA